MNNAPMRICMVCGNMSAREIVTDLPVEVPEGKLLIKDDRRTLCLDEECAEEYYTEDQLTEHDSKVVEARTTLRDSRGVLHPEDIRRIRAKYGLTQRQFEEALGFGPKTVVRWEKGTQMPGVAADNLLRLIDQFPAAFEYIHRLRVGTVFNVCQVAHFQTPSYENGIFVSPGSSDKSQNSGVFLKSGVLPWDPLNQGANINTIMGHFTCPSSENKSDNPISKIK